MRFWWIIALIIALAVPALLLTIPSASGSNPATPFLALAAVPVPEIPAKAAELVQTAPAAQRGQTLQEVMRAVSAVARPGVLPFVVNAISRGAPEMAGSVTSLAMGLQPEDEFYFCRAATCAAPGQAREILEAACRADPPNYANFAIVVWQQAPAAGGAILAGLTAAVPGLGHFLERAEIEVGTNNLQEVVIKTTQLVAAASQPAK